GGLDVQHGEHLLIADNPADFANQVVQLLQDEQLRRKLATNAGRLIDEKYSWEQSIAQLETAYAQSIYEYNHRGKLAEAYPTRTAEVVRVRFDAPIAAGVQFQGGDAAQAYALPTLSRRTTEHRSYLIFKRILDIFSAVIGVGVMLLLCPLIWLVNQLTSPGNLFYVQERVGQDGRPFRMIKFRSMVMMAEADTGPVWAELDDPRITPFGRILRKSRMDELPQFLNVLRGEMSLIGPRPERPEFVKTLVKTFPEFEVRHVVKPGITGWAQINYRYVASIDDTQIKLQYDLEYIKLQGIRLDILILLKTVLVMLRMQGH
ncbi:MAG: sugar transferase, partial [Candidatus Promineifilaceae bacterium]